MGAKDYLERAFYLKQKIDLKLDRLAMLQESAVRRSASISAATGGSSNLQKMESSIVKIADLKEEIGLDIMALNQLEDEIESTIKLIGDDKIEFVLISRYIYFECWDDIATKMNYASSYIFKLHRKGIDILDDKMKING